MHNQMATHTYVCVHFAYVCRLSLTMFKSLKWFFFLLAWLKNLCLSRGEIDGWEGGGGKLPLCGCKYAYMTALLTFIGEL